MGRSVFVFLAVSLLVLAVGYAVIVPNRETDFTSFYYAAIAIKQGVDPYDVNALRRLGVGHRVWPYLYSPFLAAVLVPITHWRVGRAVHGWMYVAAMAFGLTSAVANHRTRTPTIHAIAFSLLAGMGLNLFNVLDLGQINTIVLVPITLAFVLRERRPVIAGASLALAGILKTSPFYLLVVFAAERRWRMLVATLGTTLLLVALTIPIVGVHTWQSFIALGQRISAELTIPGLFSLGEQWSFSITANVMRAHLDPHVFTPLVTLALTIPIAIASWRGRKGTLLSALAVMVLSAPLAYTHHVIYLFPGVLLAFTEATARRRTYYATALLVTAFAAGVDFPLTGHAGRSFMAVLALYVLGFFA